MRQVWHLLTDDRSKNAIVVAEKYAVGEATVEELDLAWATPEWSAATWSATKWAAEACAAEAATEVAADYEKWSARYAQASYLRERFNPFLKDETK